MDETPTAGRRSHERRWPATLAVVCVLALQLALPDQVTLGLRWLPVVLEAVLLVPITFANPVHLSRDTPWLRFAGLGVIVLVAVANVAHLGAMVSVVLAGRQLAAGELLRAATLIWVTNVVAATLALWELDRGGPFARDPRHGRPAGRPDLLFPQMTGVPGWDADTWLPGFADYLFVAFTAATAFSPTDTLPLSARAKLVIGAAGGVALLTLAVVAARAVNIV